MLMFTDGIDEAWGASGQYGLEAAGLAPRIRRRPGGGDLRGGGIRRHGSS